MCATNYLYHKILGKASQELMKIQEHKLRAVDFFKLKP